MGETSILLAFLCTVADLASKSWEIAHLNLPQLKSIPWSTYTSVKRFTSAMFQLFRQNHLDLRMRRSLSSRAVSSVSCNGVNFVYNRKDSLYPSKRNFSTKESIAATEQSTNATTMKILHMVRAFRNRGTSCSSNFLKYPSEHSRLSHSVLSKG